MIRLRPQGKRGQKTYIMIVNEKTKDVFGDYMEQVGFYDPNVSPAKVELNTERIQYWLSKGAQPSATMHNILVDAKVIAADKKLKGPVAKVAPVAETPAEVAPAAVEAAPAEAPATEAPVEQPAA